MAKERDEQPEMTLPRDPFSTAMRTLGNNPGAVRRESVVNIVDDYGNLTTWVVTTFRADGADTVLLQKQGPPDAPIRLVLPPKVMAAIGRQQDGATTANRKRGARAAVATRKLRGIEPAFLKAGEGRKR